MAEQLSEIYKQLNYPSAAVFHRALAKRGIPARLADIQEFVSSRSERQVIAPPPKFTGKIVAFDINARWAADLISFVTRPVKSNEGAMAHVLIVQDIFSRFIWTVAMTSIC